MVTTIITVTKPQGFSKVIIPLNGTSCWWDSKENLQGQTCADPNNYNDRFLPSVYSDTIINLCFGSCSPLCAPPCLAPNNIIASNITPNSVIFLGQLELMKHYGI